MIFFKRPIGTCAYLGGLPAVLEEFTWSWGQLIQLNSEYLIQHPVGGPGMVCYDRATTSEHAVARNYLSKRMQGDWLWMTDTDHAFDPDIVVRMVSLLNKYDQIDVLSALYRYKVPPYIPNVFWWNHSKQKYISVAEVPKTCELWGGEELCVGAGCLLVRRRVFEKIRNEMKEEPFDKRKSPDGKMFSEDFSFFVRCRELGLKSFIAPQIESHHLRVQRISSDDFNPEEVSVVKYDTKTEEVAFIS